MSPVRCRFPAWVRRVVAGVALGALISGCGAASSAGPTTTTRASSGTIVQLAAASCAGLTRSQQFAAAKVIFNATMLPGPTAPGTDGVLASPARVRVERYLKGSGATIVTVQTALKTVNPATTLVTEDGIRPRAGQRWQIYTSTRSQPYATSICLGSHRLPGALTAQFTAAGQLSFDYPAAWHARTFPMPAAPFTGWLVWLSPQRMHPPCVTRHGTHNTTITCHDPITHLHRHSILAFWTTNADPAGRPHLHGARPITVDGRRGTWLHQAGRGQAPNLGQTEMITVIVPTPGTRDSWHELIAFLRGPGTTQLQTQVKTMLRSVRWRD